MITGWLLSLSGPHLHPPTPAPTTPSKQGLIIPLVVSKGNLARSRSQLSSPILPFAPSAANAPLVEFRALRHKQQPCPFAHGCVLLIPLGPLLGVSAFHAGLLVSLWNTEPALAGMGVGATHSPAFHLGSSIYLPTKQVVKPGEPALLPNKPLAQPYCLAFDFCCFVLFWTGSYIV